MLLALGSTRGTGASGMEIGTEEGTAGGSAVTQLGTPEGISSETVVPEQAVVVSSDTS